MTNETIIYEQPLNEQIRLCLRLEYLFEQANYYLPCESPWDLRQTLNTILEILHIADRPDLRNKFGQALNQHASSLTQLEKLPDIDKQKLHSMLEQIDQLIDEIRINTQKTGQELRENEFLTAIQQRLYTPAGTCNFSLPAYHLWLHQDKTILKQQLSHWLDSFKQLQAITNLMLKLTRESASFKNTKAIGGFYQTNLEPSIQHQMIRISIAPENRLFPEISVGRHRLAIHFFTLDINGRAAQTPNDIIFALACCKL
ncbi:Cell division protein ZapD [Gammaproteobacteria bacterium]